MSGALRVFTLSDGRRVKEVKDTHQCDGCMFDLGPHADCPGLDNHYQDIVGCSDRGTIYQPADPEPAAVAEPVMREPVKGGVVMAMFHMAVGGFMPSLDHAYRRGFRDAEKAHGIGGQAAEPVKREPLTEQSIVDLIPTTGITSSREAIWFARAIERAHGIGQQDKVGQS